MNSAMIMLSLFSDVCLFPKHRTDIESDEDERKHDNDVEETLRESVLTFVESA